MIRNICCIGSDYIGGPTMPVMAGRCPDVPVRVVDLNQVRVDASSDVDLSRLLVYEDGLDRVGGRGRVKNTCSSRLIALSSSQLIQAKYPYCV